MASYYNDFNDILFVIVLIVLYFQVFQTRCKSRNHVTPLCSYYCQCSIVAPGGGSAQGHSLLWAREAWGSLWVAIYPTTCRGCGGQRQGGKCVGANISGQCTWNSCFFHSISFRFLPLFRSILQNCVLNPVLPGSTSGKSYSLPGFKPPYLQGSKDWKIL